MSRPRLLLFCFLCCLSNSLFSQANMPSYLNVVRHFFSNYSHEREDPYDRVYFAKKKDGWYINIVDISKEEKVKNSQLFWELNKKQYKPLKGFEEGLLQEEIESRIETFLQESDPTFLYNFERCRYFGYNEWDVDMIRDFAGKQGLTDTLLEGLGRAYAFYAERYLWSGLGGYPYDDDTLKRKLGRLEIPGKERIDMFIQNIGKSITVYTELDERYPGYQLRVGTAG